MTRIKDKIIDKIREIQDEALLKEILHVVEVESGIEEVYELSDAERKAVEEGMKEAGNGLTIPHEKANQMVREWLKK